LSLEIGFISSLVKGKERRSDGYSALTILMLILFSILCPKLCNKATNMQCSLVLKPKVFFNSLFFMVVLKMVNRVYIKFNRLNRHTGKVVILISTLGYVNSISRSASECGHSYRAIDIACKFFMQHLTFEIPVLYHALKQGIVAAKSIYLKYTMLPVQLHFSRVRLLSTGSVFLSEMMGRCPTNVILSITKI